MDLSTLSCIDLDQPQLEGFRSFISSWLIQNEHYSLVVDPGPLSTIPTLVKALRTKGVEKLDYILLTHIHIDHAGGTGELLKYFPEAQVICHPDGIAHMINPDKLWQGSLQVLGEMAQIYGEIVAVPSRSIRFEETLPHGITVHKTPGHAPHHLCFSVEDLLFGGEVCGVHCHVKMGLYMRPATPPRFIYDVAVDSIDRMMALKPRYLVIAHHGLVEPAMCYLETARHQLERWVEAVAATRHSSEEGRNQAIYHWLLKHDKVFSSINQLDDDIIARERYFMGNSIRGIRGYFEHLTPQQQQHWVEQALSGANGAQ